VYNGGRIKYRLYASFDKVQPQFWTAKRALIRPARYLQSGDRPSVRLEYAHATDRAVTALPLKNFFFSQWVLASGLGRLDDARPDRQRRFILLGIGSQPVDHRQRPLLPPHCMGGGDSAALSCAGGFRGERCCSSNGRGKAVYGDVITGTALEFPHFKCFLPHLEGLGPQPTTVTGV